jgi:hypothetical protein
MMTISAAGVADAHAAPAPRRPAALTGRMRLNGLVQRIATTVVALVGEPARACLDALGQAANVVTVRPEDAAAPLERAATAWQTATRIHTPYLLHDADPLQTVANAWARRFDVEQPGPAGELEVAVAETLRRWRAGAIELPDYYLVLDPEGWEANRRHFYLGVLHGASPSRVVPVAGTPERVAAQLSGLGSGRWWPEVDRLLDGIDRVVPDRVRPAPPDGPP